jgi:CNT family concentrative nucleoside transporter
MRRLCDLRAPLAEEADTSIKGGNVDGSMDRHGFSACLQALLGMFTFLALAYGLSESRRTVKFRPVLWALMTQILLAVTITRVPAVRGLFLLLSDGIDQIKGATLAGTSFVFGHVGGGPAPFDVTHPENAFVFAAQALPMVMVVSALSMLLFHWRILPTVVRLFSFVLRRTLHIGGALGVCAAAKTFLGQTEAPLLIRPYLRDLTRSELFSVMTLGMATTSASVMVLYASFLQDVVSHPISHILTASIISVPAAIALSRLMIPQDGPDTEGSLEPPYRFSGAMEAISTGATDGMKLFINIIAMLIVMLALVALTNKCLGVVSLFDAPLSLQRILGVLMSPVTWLMGVPWCEAQAAGNLIGTKLALNEVMAFIELSRLAPGALSDTSRLIMLYALCGFANLASVGIQIGGIGTMVPERRAEIISLGMRSLLAGTLASCMSGTLMGLVAALLGA